jgi:hypothetical protein
MSDIDWDMLKIRVEILLNWLLALVVVWVFITTTIDRFKNPDKTETELFKSIPKSFILNFE